MKVCFVLPKYQRHPIGGYKIVYEYANRLVEKGYDVCILHMNSDIRSHYYRFPEIAIKILAEIMTRIEPRWFDLDQRVQKYSNLTPRELQQARESDVMVATSLGTVEYAFELSNTARKIYLIQGYEAWNGFTDEQVFNSYRTDSVKIVISNWLKDIVDQYSPRPSVLIKNPIDLNQYRIKTPLLDRDRYSIGLLYHTMTVKGFPIARRVLKRLKNECPRLEVYMFGASVPDFKLPDWIHFTHNATREQTVEIYNRCRTFLCTSIKEGFGLTGYEAMACGCVLVSTEYEGVKEYAKDRYNAMLAPVNDVKTLTELVLTSMQDDIIADRLSRNGRESLREFSWDIAIDRFIAAIN